MAGVAGAVAFLVLARTTGLMKKSTNSSSLKPSPLMADATGSAIAMTLLFIGVEQRVGFHQFFATGMTWLVYVGLGTFVRKLPGPPTANS
jgi:hypothetical protein